MIKQPEKSNLCGQCCLGTILNISLEEAIKLVGHRHTTNTKELTKHFRAGSDKLTRLIMYNYCLCRIHFGKAKQTHWVIYKSDQIYDPIVGEYIPYPKWKEIVSKNIRITSSVEILTEKSQIKTE
jgi:hypothetical protein